MKRFMAAMGVAIPKMICYHCNKIIEYIDETIVGDIPFHKDCFYESDLYKSWLEYFDKEKERKSEG